MFGTIRLYITMLVFAATLILGGVSSGAPIQNLILNMSWIATISLWLPDYINGFATRRGMYATLIALSGLALMAIQLIPLPVSIWHQFPGRQFVKDALELSGQAQISMPISLDPAATKAAIVSTTCGIAFFLAGQKVQQSKQIHFFMVLLVFGLLSVILGLAQKFLGPNSGLFPYQEVGESVAQGTFRNRNNFASLLYCTIPALFALAVSLIAKKRVHIIVVALFCFAYLAIVIAGIATSAARMGMLLAMLAVVLSALLTKGLANYQGNHNKNVMTKFGLAGLVVSLLVFSQFGLMSMLRFATIDTAGESRTKIFEKSLESALNYFPVGSGFGTFVPVYQLTERPQDMLEGVYVNHAHNDWIELFLEGGAIMAIVMLAYLIWYLVATYTVWKNVGFQSNDLIAKASSLITLLLMLHSIVEFPTRMPALMAVFCLCLGFMCAASVPLRSRKPSRSTNTDIPQTDQLRRPPPRFSPQPRET